jgi:signal transduction histidine kinase
MPNQSLYATLETEEFVEKIDQTPAQEYWYRAIATLNQVWDEIARTENIFLTNTPQVLSDYGHNLDLWGQIWIFTASKILLSTSFAISKTHIVQLDDDIRAKFDKTESRAGSERFLLCLNTQFAILFVSNEENFLFSLHPHPISLGIGFLRQLIVNAEQIKIFNQNLNKFPLLMPTYKLMSKFAGVLLTTSTSQELQIPDIKEVDIIKAIAHEVKTPLTIISTLVQSLLRHQDVSPEVKNRLEKIDFECQDQISRFNLIFEIVRLDHQNIISESFDLKEILETNIIFWHKQAYRRQIQLEVKMLMPTKIKTNRKLLAQLFDSLIDRLTRSLPAHSLITITTTNVGKYVKVQLTPNNKYIPTYQAVGKWLMLQPDTGTLSLSLMICKVLFGLIGSKFTVKTYLTSEGYKGEIFTIFLPIAS